MPNKNLKNGDILIVYLSKLHNNTPRDARVRSPHTSIAGRYIVEYLDTGEEERNVSYKRCTFNYDNLEGGGLGESIADNIRKATDEDRFKLGQIIEYDDEYSPDNRFFLKKSLL